MAGPQDALGPGRHSPAMRELFEHWYATRPQDRPQEIGAQEHTAPAPSPVATTPTPLRHVVSPLSQALAFHEAFLLPRHARPTHDPSLNAARLRFIREEVKELSDALGAVDMVEMADALADIAYFVYASAVVWGIDLDAVMAEVHASNMSKLDENGRAVFREDGKVLKSELYWPPDIARVLKEQGLLFDIPFEDLVFAPRPRPTEPDRDTTTTPRKEN